MYRSGASQRADSTHSLWPRTTKFVNHTNWGTHDMFVRGSEQTRPLAPLGWPCEVCARIRSPFLSVQAILPGMSLQGLPERCWPLYYTPTSYTWWVSVGVNYVVCLSDDPCQVFCICCLYLWRYLTYNYNCDEVLEHYRLLLGIEINWNQISNLVNYSILFLNVWLNHYIWCHFYSNKST